MCIEFKEMKITFDKGSLTCLDDRGGDTGDLLYNAIIDGKSEVFTWEDFQASRMPWNMPKDYMPWIIGFHQTMILHDNVFIR